MKGIEEHQKLQRYLFSSVKQPKYSEEVKKFGKKFLDTVTIPALCQTSPFLIDCPLHVIQNSFEQMEDLVSFAEEPTDPNEKKNGETAHQTFHCRVGIPNPYFHLAIIEMLITIFYLVLW